MTRTSLCVCDILSPPPFPPQLLTTLLGGSNDNDTSKSRKKKKKSRQSAPGRPDLAPWVRSAWESAVQAPPELVWPGSSSESTSSTGDEAEAVLDEDVLGPPWVEPNRHCKCGGKFC